MKRFKFSLAKLLEIKEQQLKQEKERLAELRRNQMLLEQAKQEVLRKSREYNQRFNAQMQAGGVSVQEIITSKGYLTALREEGLRLDEKIFQAQKLAEEQMQVVIQATMDIKVLEKLRSQKLLAHNKELTRAEEIFIEEYINTSKFMSEDNP